MKHKQQRLKDEFVEKVFLEASWAGKSVGRKSLVLSCQQND